MTKEMLDNYTDMQGYVDDLERKVDRLVKEIDKLRKRIVEIEAGENVIDTVSGGEGGIQHFKIEGVPTKEYKEKKYRLYLKTLSYNQLSPILREQQKDLIEKTVEVEQFIASIDDFTVKRIVNLRFVENFSWSEVAITMGGGNTEDSVRKAYTRYMDKL